MPDDKNTVQHTMDQFRIPLMLHIHLKTFKFDGIVTHAKIAHRPIPPKRKNFVPEKQCQIVNRYIVKPCPYVEFSRRLKNF